MQCQSWVIGIAVVFGSGQGWASVPGTFVAQENPVMAAEPVMVAAKVEIDALSLEDMLKTEVTVATRSVSKSAADSPAIVSVITREEILRTGARDLIDILDQVPGFQLAADNFNAVYPGVRGLWAAEGRIVYLMDGQPLHDLMYSLVPFGNHYSVDWIERIEIIRGPGSAIYGGTAELAVLNIITRSAAALEGVAITGTYGQMFDGAAHDDVSLAQSFGRRNLSLSGGKVLKDLGDLGVAAHLFVGQGNRSDQIYTDVYGDSFKMPRNAATDPLALNVNVDWQGLHVGYLFDRYVLGVRDGYDSIVPERATSSTTQHVLTANYRLAPLAGLTVTPELRFIYQKPWVTVDDIFEPGDAYYWDPTANRLQASVQAAYDVLPEVNLLAGFEYARDHAVDEVAGFVDPDDATNTRSEITFTNMAAYLQGLAYTEYLNVSLGARFEHHSRFGNSLVPRLALMRNFGRAHAKLLVSQAFHAPTIYNLALTSEVTPERATVYELQLGGQLSDTLFFSANIFDSTVKKPIIYYYDQALETEQYINGERLGSRGFELEAKWRYAGHFVSVSYSFYDPMGKNQVETYNVPDNERAYVGFSPHKLAFQTAWLLYRDLSLGVTGTVQNGTRYAYTGVNAQGEATGEDLGTLTLVNLNLMYQGLGVEGLALSLAVYDLFNQKRVFIQPYNNAHAPLPGPSREVVLRLGYEFPM